MAAHILSSTLCLTGGSLRKYVPAPKQRYVGVPTRCEAHTEERDGTARGLAPSRRELLCGGGVLGAAQLFQPIGAALADEAATSSRVIVTGSNTGIGKAMARQLADQGYTVVLACRNPAKAAAAEREIIATTGNRNVSSMVLDLADLSSVRAFASAFNSTSQPLQMLCNNAGVMATPEMVTADGFEYQLGVNHLGHFLLTSLLADALLAGGSAAAASRVVSTTSAAHMIPGTLDLDDLNWRKRKYAKWPAYGQSKLCNVLFTRELARRADALGAPLVSNCFHPGVVDTDLIRYVVGDEVMAKKAADGEKSKTVTKLLGLRTPDEGASTGTYLASSLEVKVSGEYWDSKKVQPGSKASQDMAAAARLWDISRELTGAPNVLVA